MKYTAEEIQYDFNHKFFWVRIYVESEDGKKTTAIIGAGRNYLNDFFEIPGDKSLQDEHKNKWVELVISDLKEELTEIKDAPYLKVYTQTQEGYNNGLKFLSEVTP